MIKNREYDVIIRLNVNEPENNNYAYIKKKNTILTPIY